MHSLMAHVEFQTLDGTFDTVILKQDVFIASCHRNSMVLPAYEEKDPLPHKPFIGKSCNCDLSLKELKQHARDIGLADTWRSPDVVQLGNARKAQEAAECAVVVAVATS